eukprot:scaffold6271_cov18-Prasinocladus_malaysianus.AAC.1
MIHTGYLHPWVVFHSKVKRPIGRSIYSDQQGCRQVGALWLQHGNPTHRMACKLIHGNRYIIDHAEIA